MPICPMWYHLQMATINGLSVIDTLSNFILLHQTHFTNTNFSPFCHYYDNWLTISAIYCLISIVQILCKPLGKPVSWIIMVFYFQSHFMVSHSVHKWFINKTKDTLIYQDPTVHSSVSYCNASNSGEQIFQDTPIPGSCVGHPLNLSLF